MAGKMRIVLADDSAVVRRLLTEALNSDPALEVIGAAKNGQEAVAIIQSKPAELVLLDVEMPVMDGIEAVHAIRKFNQRIPIVMFSSLTVKGGAATLDALAAGASDFVPKPSSVGHFQQALDYLQQELIPKIKQFGKVSSPAIVPFRLSGSSPHTTQVASSVGKVEQLPIPAGPQFAVNPASVVGAAPGSLGKGQIDVVAVASSTGGPVALEEVLRDLPGDLAATILVVQHMPPMFTQILAERLDKYCALQVREAYDGVAIAPGQVWIAPGDFHLRVERLGTRHVLRTDKSPHENSCRPAADVLFRSVAQSFGARALAVVLTGMGKDGLAGTREIRARGGRVIAQDEATSVVWGMPRAIAEAGLVERCLPVAQIGRELLTAVSRPSKALAHA